MANPSDEHPRLLAPHEKRAPRIIPWRLDGRETVAGIAVAAVVVVSIVWLMLVFLRGDDLAWRSDGIIVEVRGAPGDPPRASVTTVSHNQESYPWAFPPRNEGAGSCKNPRFRLDGMPERGKTYAATDSLSITVVYDAPGCKDNRATFIGEGQFPSERVALDRESGVVTLMARPGTAPDVAASSPPGWVSRSPPTLEGFELCSIVLVVSDATMQGSQSIQQVFVDCHRARDYPRGTRFP